MRKGNTQISSVSISNEMKQLIQEHDLSITEAMRRGVAMMLCEKKVKPYYNSLNDIRLNQEKSYYLSLKLQEMKEIIERMDTLLK